MPHHTHDIVVSLNRLRLFLLLSVIVLLGLMLLGLDMFAIWAFWNQYHIDTGAYVAAVILFIGTLFFGWAIALMFHRLRQQGPVIIINSQGLYVDFPLRFTLVPRFKQSFLPWEEIEWVSSFQRGMYTWLTLSLKDPERYWSRYGKGKYRKWRRDSITGAHINIVQFSLSLSARQILQQIEENYSPELLQYNVKVIHRSAFKLSLSWRSAFVFRQQNR